jgi:hypothetical protein
LSDEVVDAPRPKRSAHCRLADLLSHIYVLLPVMDNKKHYWVEGAEIDKLLRRGEGWLPAHPAKDLIVSRYLRHQRSLTRVARERLVEEEGEPEESAGDAVEEQVEQPVRQKRGAPAGGARGARGVRCVARRRSRLR